MERLDRGRRLTLHDQRGGQSSPGEESDRPGPVVQTHATGAELDQRARFRETFERSPIPPDELLANLGLFVNRQTLSRLIFLHEMYQRILTVHGVVMEFGVRWGRDLAAFANFRGMYEPYNYPRRIIGFDTFEGFVGLDDADATGVARIGDYGVSPGYDDYLRTVLEQQEGDSPLAHITKFELVRGDASTTVHEYLERHPETIVALAYFDLDVYGPTKACLEAIRPRLTTGSVVGFDEACFAEFPGETIALLETFDLNRCRLHRNPIAPTPCYLVI